MKLAKKTLSVLLSVLIIISSISVCFGTIVFAAESQYTADDVKSLVADAVKGAVGTGSGNNYTFNGTNSVAVWKAAEAVYDYAVNKIATADYGVAIGDSSKENANGEVGTNKLANKLINHLKYADNSSEAQFIRNILDPAGTALNAYGTSTKNSSGSYVTTSSSQRMQAGTDCTNDSHCPDDVKNNWVADVTKTATINKSLSEYLMSVDSLDAIPDAGFALTVTYRLTNYVGRYVVVTSGKSRKVWFIDNWDFNVTGYNWHYLGAVNRQESNVNTTAKGELLSAKAYFDNLKNTAADSFLASYNLGDLINKRTEATNKYNSLTNTYSIDVIKKHVAADINTVLLNLNEAVDRLNNAATNMRNMLSYINAGFTPITTENVGEVNIDDYNALYANANAAYTAVVGLPDATVESVKSGAADLASFSKADSKAWLDSLNESISLYNAVQLKATIDNAYAVNNAAIADKYIGEEFISNEAVELLKGNITALVSSFNGLTETARTIVFGGTSYADLDEMNNNIIALSNVRNAEVDYDTNYYQYFEPKMSSNIGELKNAEITALYDEALAKKDAYNNAYAGYVQSLGQDTVDAIFFDINYKGEEMSMAQAAAEYVESLKANIIERNDTQLAVVKNYSNVDKVDFNNITAVKNATSRFDEDLYSFVQAKGWLSAQNEADYALADSVIQKVKDFVATGGLDFTELHHHDANGVFTVREGSTAEDIARKDGEDFAVTESNINASIAKLDKFITSKDFTSLVGLENIETGEAYEDLSTAITEVLNENLFSDQMVNTLIGTIYPMLAETIGGLLTDLSEIAPDMIGKSDDPDSAGVIDLGTLVDGMGGHLNIYFNGKKGTDTLLKDLDNLGLRLYPLQLAQMPEMAKYPEIKAILEDAGTGWKLITENEDYLDEDGNLNFVWGVTDYNSFIDVVSMIFESIGPLLTALVSGKTYSDELGGKAAFAVIPDLSYSILSGSVEAYAKAKIEITGQNIFQTVWIPAMEALGVTDYTAQGYTFANINPNSSYRDIANAMFSPILELVNQLSSQPIDKVLSIIPTLMYLLSMDYIQETLNNISIPLKVNLEITDITKTSLGSLLTSILNAAKGLINDALPTIEPELVLGSLLDLQDLLGFDLSNVNDVFDFVLETVGIDATLPVLNAGQFVLASHAETASSQRPGGTRNRLVADKADVLYLLLEYLLTAAGDSELIDAIIDFVAASEAEKDPEAEPVEIPEIVYTILANINGNTEEALAALVELVNPQKYETMSFDWYTSPYTYSTDIENFDASSIPYLKYSNDWTREKAEYLIENIDEVLEVVLEMVGAEETDINAVLQGSVANLFNNLNFTGFVEMLVKLGYLIDNEFVYDLISREFGLDLRTWAKTFGEFFPEAIEQLKEENPDLVIPETFPEAVPVIEGVSFNEGVWTVNGTTFVDGNRDTFLDLFTTVCAPFAKIIAALFTGENISLFNNAITILGYDNYKNSIGVLFELVGISEIEELGEYQGVLTQEEYAAMDPDDAFNFLTKQLFAWVDYLFEGNTVEKIIELIPRFMYFFESNGLSAAIHNLLMPILVIVDIARPIIDIDINAIASTLISDILNGISDSLAEGTELALNLDLDRILSLLSGTGISDLNPDHKAYAIDVNNLSIGSILVLVDTFLGTSLATSPLATYGVAGLCAGKKQIPNSVIGTAYGSAVSAADTVTILVTALLETLQAPCYDESGAETTNGLAICNFIQNMLNNSEEATDINVVEVYNMIIDVIAGVDAQYANPNWSYMFSGSFDVVNGSVNLPEHTINYLQYDNDWDKDTAKALDENFDALVELLLDSFLEEDSTVAGLINDLLNDEVYKDANLNTIVEILVTLFADFDVSLRNLLGTALSVNIDEWFTMCEIERDEDGKVVSVTCNANFGVDSAADKKVAFVNGLKSILAPADRLLSWIFFGDDYKFFTGSKKDKDGNYIYDDVLTIGGGEGYAYGLVPILEAFGCEAKPADTFYNEETGKYDIGAAVDSIINALLDRVDEIAGKPAHEVLALIPNLIYFINADGINTSLNNLLASLNALLDKFAPILGEDEISVMSVLEGIAGIELSDLSMGAIIDLVTDMADIIITDEQKAIIENFYIGKLTQFVSANGEFAYKMEYTDEESRADMITIILSIAIEFIRENRAFLTEIIGEDTYKAIVSLLSGYDGMFVYKSPDWAYMYDGENALAQLSANGLPNRTGEAYANYTKYTNNWNKETAEYLTANLQEIVDSIISSLSETDTTVGVMLENAIAGGIYKDEVLASLLETVVKLLADLDASLVKTVGAVIGVDIDTWFSWCTIERDADGKVTNVTCTKDWNIDSKLTNSAKKDAFIAAFTEALAPANRILAWLFLGQDYTFLNDANGEDLITITGGEGYDFGIVPILEALGVTVKGAADYREADGKYDVSAVVGDVVTAICDLVAEICGGKTIDIVLDKLPNIIYFINAGGISASVNNLLVPVNYLLEKLEPVVGKVDIEELIGFPITNITFETIFDLLADSMDINIKDEHKQFIETFFMGKVDAFTSANGGTAYRMTYSQKETSRDMMTIILSILLENVRYEKNKDALTKVLGEETYQAINEVLSIMKAKEMQEFSWLYTEYADTDKTFSAIETSTMYKGTYNDIWTKEKAQYIADNLPDFINSLICLIGLEINGVQIRDLNLLIEQFIDGNLYTQANADSILDLFRTVTSQLTQLDPYGKYIAGILKSSIGVDIKAWDNMTVKVTDGNKEEFANAIAKMVAPLAPLFKVLLVGEDLKFFYDINGKDQIVIPGSEGYAYGIVPLLEALGCKNVLTPAKFASVLKSSPDAAVRAVLDPVLNRLEDISKDPANKILDMLPGVIYFIDSNGLDTSVKNILNSLDTVIAALEPIIGASDILTLAGLDLKTYNFDWIVNFALDMVKDATGYDLKPLAFDAISELIVGKVVSYKSVNGETYYTMKYASKADKADMVTILLRLFVSFIVSDENISKVEGVLAKYITDEKLLNINCTLLRFLASKAKEDKAMSGALFVIYYIYYGLDKGVDGADSIYHNINNTWKAVLQELDNDSNPIIRGISAELKKALDKHLGGIFDSDGLASQGTLTFWQRIKAFFDKIFGWFKNLFN